MRFLLYILLAFISPEVFAGVFDPPPTDQSVHILGLIFGSNIGSISLGGAPNPIMSDIMEKFNFIIVVVGSVVLSYVVVLSVINTAQEGTAMGKKWSAIWVPMRSIAGMSLMVPSPGTGYSLIQQTVIWIIIQGIGAADQIWNIALDGLKHGASVTFGVTQDKQSGNTGQLANDADALVTKLAQIAICMEGMQQVGKTSTPLTPWLYNNASSIKAYIEPDTPTPSAPSSNPLIKTTAVKFSGTMRFGVKDSNDLAANHAATCGTAVISGTAKVDDFGGEGYFNDKSEQERYKILAQSAEQIYETKVLAITSMLGILQPMAEAIVQGSAKPATAISQHDMDSSWQKGYYAAATDSYAKLLSSLIVPVESASVTANKDLSDAITQGEQKGWIVAGAYYFVLNRALATKTFDDIHNKPSLTTTIECTGSCTTDYINNTYDLNHVPAAPATPSTAQLYINQLSIPLQQANQLNTWLATGDVYIGLDKGNSNNIGLNLGQSLGGGVNPIIDALAAPIKALQGALYNAMNANAGTPQGDVLLTHAQLGRDMMLSMEFTWISLFGVIAILGLATGLAIPFTAGPGALFIGILMTAFGVVLPIIGMVWTIGAGLAIYAPLIPFMIFTVGALGWLLAVIEAIIAAPLIALGLVTPAGDELGKVETALMILSNIFLRPMLMVFGFFLSGRLYNAVVSLIDLGMLQVFNTINVETIFSALVIFFAYASFVIGMTNTCFSLIYAIPDKIMRWIGGHAEQTDVSAIQQVKGAVSQAAGEVGKSGAEMGKAGASATASKAKSNRENAEKKKSEGGGGSGMGGMGGGGGGGGGAPPVPPP